MNNTELIAEAESFAAGCSRDRLELRLVDALKAAEATIAEAKAAWFGPCQFDLATDGPKVSEALGANRG